MATSFTAKYRGRCDSGCDRDIEPGDDVIRIDEDLVHNECALDVNVPVPAQREAIDRTETTRQALVEARERTLEMQRLHDRVWSQKVEWKGRHAALRADVGRVAQEASGHSERLLNMGGDVDHRVCALHAKRELQNILNRDDERGRDA